MPSIFLCVCWLFVCLRQKKYLFIIVSLLTLLNQIQIPWRMKWQPSPVFFAGEFHGQRSQVGTVCGVSELDTTELLAPALSLHKQSIPGFPGDSAIKDLLAHAGDAEDMCTIPGSGRSTAGGNGTPLQYSCLGNPMDRGAWWATVHGTAELNTT